MADPWTDKDSLKRELDQVRKSRDFVGQDWVDWAGPSYESIQESLSENWNLANNGRHVNLLRDRYCVVDAAYRILLDALEKLEDELEAQT